MSQPATSRSSAARRWRVAVPAIAAFVAAGHFGCNKQFSPPPGPSGNFGYGGSGVIYGVGGNPGVRDGGYGVGGYPYGVGGYYGGAGGYYYPDGGPRPCVGSYPSCWPTGSYCVNDPYPPTCDPTSGLWVCPPGFTTTRPPTSQCGVGGFGGTQCEMLPLLGSGGATGAGGAAGPVDAGAVSADAGAGSADAGAVSDAAAAGPGLSFSSARTYSPGGHPGKVAVGDMNGDGHLDIVVTSQSGGDAGMTWRVNVLLNLGDGTFSAPLSNPVTNSQSPSIAVGDLNGDGTPDVAITDTLAGGVDVLMNRGDGTLAAPIRNLFNGLATALTIADVDGNGRPDLIVTFNQFPSTIGVAVLSNQGGGIFAGPRVFSVGTNPNGIAAGDLNHDGLIDLAVVNDDSEVAGGSGNLFVLLNQGSGLFAPPVAYPAGEFLSAVAEADLNGDGQPDLAVLDSSSNVSVMLNEGSGSFVGPLRYSAQHPSSGFALGDVTGDGRVDIVSSVPLQQLGFNSWQYGTVSVLANGGNAIFGRSIDIPDEPIQGSIALGDFNGDGKLDVVAVNHTYECIDSIGVLLNTSP